MGMGGSCVLVHAVLVLTVSFFVLFALQKQESGGLKIFGYVVAALLWLSAALLLGQGLNQMSCRKMTRCSMMDKGRGMSQHGAQMNPGMPGMNMGPGAEGSRQVDWQS